MAIIIGGIVVVVLLIVFGVCNSAGQADQYDEDHGGARRS